MDSEPVWAMPRDRAAWRGGGSGPLPLSISRAGLIDHLSDESLEQVEEVQMQQTAVTGLKETSDFKCKNGSFSLGGVVEGANCPIIGIQFHGMRFGSSFVAHVILGVISHLQTMTIQVVVIPKRISRWYFHAF